MATKTITVPGIDGDIKLQKRRGSRSVRLRVTQGGAVVVTLPYLVPYAVAVGFVKQHLDWVAQEQQKHQTVLANDMPIGRAHTLRFVRDETITKPRSRVNQNEVIIWYNQTVSDSAVQQMALVAAKRALKKEAEQFLPKRLQDIARAENYDYNGLTIKPLKGRWGSCNQDKHITLNIFLMQLPTELIDYVILHELAHTRMLHHGAGFWQEFEAHLPDAKRKRALLKQYQPSIPAERVA